MKLKKWEWGIIGLVILIFIGVAWALDESITVSYTAKGLTTSKYADANINHALIVVQQNYIRFTMDGVLTPTSAGVGTRLEIGQNFTVPSRAFLSKFKAVRGNNSADAILKVIYY